MRMYLSSYRIPNLKEFRKILFKEISDCSVAVITNAKDYRERETREYKLKLLKSDLIDIGFLKVDLVDLNNFSDVNAIKKLLSEYDIIFVAGGSTPALSLSMKNSGFDKIIRDLLVDKIYIGESAGAYVVGPSIEVHEATDELLGLPYLPDEGLGLIEEVIIPHADSNDYQNETKLMINVHSSRGHKIIKLNDNEAYVINEDVSFKITGKDNIYENRLRS